MQQDYLTQLIEAATDKTKTVVEQLADSFLESFGLNMDEPQEKSNHEKGYVVARSYIKTIEKTFDDPSGILSVVPFTYAYLGKETFNAALEVILQRAVKHPEEQSMLDQILTGTALLRPERRRVFLDAVREADAIDDDLFFGLPAIAMKVDPQATFSATDELPSAFKTTDVKAGMRLLSMFIKNGLYVPSRGFTAAFAEQSEHMGGFAYLGEQVDLNQTLVVAAGEINGFELEKIAYTSRIDRRPREYGNTNPGVVVVSDEKVHFDDVQNIYPSSTILYLARDEKQKAAMGKLLDERNKLALVDLSQEKDMSRLGKYVLFINGQRKNDTAPINLTDLIYKKVTKAGDLAAAGNEQFYEVRNALSILGRKDLVDRLVSDRGLTLPRRTDYETVVLLSQKKEDLLPFFDRRRGKVKVDGKNVVHYTELPKDMTETGVPFVIITNKDVPLTELATGGYETATFLHLGLDSKQCTAILKANPDNGVFLVNADDLQKKGGMYKERLGQYVGETFFKAIDTGRRKGITAMHSIVKELISPEIKKARDRLLFADDLYNIGTAGRTYWSLQEKYKAFPLIEQLADGVLMETCPTGGCLRIEEPYYGCCGGGNIPDAMIDFAITYRKKVGDAKFMGELTKYHGGTPKEPWYLKTRFYQRNFRGGLPELTTNKARDVAEIDLTF